MTKKGFKLWLDTKEMIHGNIIRQIQQGIDTSKAFMCCVSTKYCESKNCYDELDYSVFTKKNIIYVMVEKISGDDKISKLKPILWYFKNQKYYKPDDINGLVNAIKTLKE